MDPQNPQNRQNNPQRVFSPDQPENRQGQEESNNDQYKSRDLSSMPYASSQPEPLPTPNGQSQINDPQEKEGFKLKLPKGPVLAGIIGGVVVIVLIIVALVATSGNKPSQTKKAASPGNTQPQALQPAQSVELEQTNNALSQDLSSLDDEKDLPNNSLDDLTLGL